MRNQNVYWPGAPLALASAALFGASAPIAKPLLGAIDPWLLAGILYLGSGFGLALYALLRKLLAAHSPEAGLRRNDIPWLAGIILFGGVLGPVLLMYGLANSTASATSLLLNLEGLATMLIAWTIYGENVDRRLLLGAAAILLGSVVLAWQDGEFAVSWGAIAVAGACFCWGIDNNLTRKVSAADPVVTSAIKGIGAGSANFAIALSQGAAIPPAPLFAVGAAIGLFAYGLSLVLFVLALRSLGTARTGAYYATAPFIGTVLSVALLGEPVTIQLAVAGVLMAAGLWLHLTEHHEHDHVHEPLAHAHRHVHDAHHQHKHSADDPPGERHAHWHEHPKLVHRHAHYPDLHHRHEH
jgi:drug/metabolite transporter (DMT)-like permease